MNKRGKRILKLIDRYVGIPILFLLGLLKRKKELPEIITTLGILTVPAIGDIILLNGLLRDIKDFNKEIKIILFVAKELKDIAEIMNTYDNLVEIEVYKPFIALKTLRLNPVDVLIDASQWLRLNAILAFFSKSKYKIGFRTKHQYKHFVFDFAPDHSDQIHELYNFKKLIFSPTIETKYLPKLKFHSEKNIKDNCAVIHTMPSGYLSDRKKWQDKNWIEVIDYLLANDMEIHFTGSVADRRSIKSLLIDYHDNPKIFNVAGKYSLKETTALLLKSKLVISVNTGIMHLASVAGCNLIALHGPTDPKRWGPLNSNATVVQSDYPEAPCLNLGFEYNCNDKTCECMKRISSESVITEIKKILKKAHVKNEV